MKLFLYLLCLWVAIAYQVQGLAMRGLPLPGDDPFYTPPLGWELSKLGQVLKSRKVQIKAIFDVNIKEAWQVMYRTSYVSKDEPTTSVTTILVPYNASNDRLLALGYFEDSNPQKCQPSYTLRAGLDGDIVSIVNLVNSIPYLDEGIIVTIPDKQGRQGSFAVGPVEGHQTLDSIRATLAFDKLHMSKKAKVGGWGYSGGALQIGWAAQLMPSYAPDLNVVAWAFGGTPTNLEELILYINKKPEAGLIMSGIESMRTTYSNFYKGLKKYGTTNLTKALDFTRTHCQVDVVTQFQNIDIFSKNWTTLGYNLFKQPVVRRVLDQQVMGQPNAQAPNVPVFMAHGASDEVVPIKGALQTFSNWCNNGMDGEFLKFTYENATHEYGMLSITAPAFNWLLQHFDGKGSQKGCSHKTYDQLVEPENYNGTMKDVLEIIDGLTGKKIGPAHAIL